MVRFETREHLTTKIQEAATSERTDQASVTDELIAERRAEAEREQRELEG